MARVLDIGALPHEVPDELYSDMFHETVVSSLPQDLYEYLGTLQEVPRKMLTEYIVWRLAEVDSGHVAPGVH